MIKIPKKAGDRIKTEIKRYQKVVEVLKEHDVSEADTVTAVKDILADVLGYDKYLELTGEQQIRGTFCDLAVKIDGKIKYLIEVKAAGVALNDNHLRQAVDYGAKEGIEWVVLTNGIDWQLHRIKFAKPITHEEVTSFSLFDLELKDEDVLRRVFLLSREAISDGAMEAFHNQSQILNCYNIAQIIQTDAVIAKVRSEFRKLFPGIKLEKEDIASMLKEEILKREVVETEKAKEASSKVKRATNKVEREKAKLAEQKAKALEVFNDTSED